MFDQAINAIEFYRNESCGKCVPCRIGSQKLAAHWATTCATEDPGLSVWNEEVLPLDQRPGRGDDDVVDLRPGVVPRAGALADGNSKFSPMTCCPTRRRRSSVRGQGGQLPRRPARLAHVRRAMHRRPRPP